MSTLLIILAILIAIWVIAKKAKASKTDTVKTAKSGEIESYFRFDMPLGDSYANYSRISFDAQYVYFPTEPLNGEKHIIGRYEKCSEGETICKFFNKDGDVVGFLSKGGNHPYVFLSRSYLYDYRVKQWGAKGTKLDDGTIVMPKHPMPPVELFAEVIDCGGGKGYLLDESSSQIIGWYYNGTVFGAAAAFCILMAELPTETPYSSFFYDGDPVEYIFTK